MAQRIPQEVIEEVRQRTNIVDVVGQYVQLKKSGKNYLGLCPFHEERSPSFSVAEDKQIFHCFGCGKGGTVFNFLQEIEGISFPEAVQRTAELEQLTVNFDWQQASDLQQAKQAATNPLVKLHEKVAALYHHVLMNTQVGEAALEYLYERGLTKELLEEFEIGFAPAKRDFLEQILRNETFSEDDFTQSGLFIQRESGARLDRFFQRIMFPIRNDRGQVIAFSGRLLKTEEFAGDDLPKYLNSPETTLFNKRDTLFNFDKARKTIRKENTVFLFEGFMDVIAAYQAGITSGVASMGTSLTNEQIRKLERVAEELVVCYDGDQAGVEATYRAVELLSQHSRLQVSIVSLPEKLDPDEYVRKYGADSFCELALHGRDTVFNFKRQYYRLNRNMTNEKEQLDYVQQLLVELVAVASPLERDRYLNQLATEFQLSFARLEEQFLQIEAQLRQQNRQQSAPPNAEPMEDFGQAYEEGPLLEQPARSTQAQRPLTLVEKAERMLLFRLMHEQATRNFLAQQPAFHFVHDECQELYLLLDSYLSVQGTFQLASFLDFLKADQMKQLAIAVEDQVISAESSERELQDLLLVIQQSALHEQIQQKKQARLEAERLGNQPVIDQLSLELIGLVRALKNSPTPSLHETR